MIKNRLHPTIIASGKDGFLMPDMLVKLYELDRYKDNREQLRAQGISIQPAMAANLSRIRRWILEHFSEGWADEATQAVLASPCRCLLAVRDGEEGGREILGFACYDTTAKGFFGPTGVSEAARGLGVGCCSAPCGIWRRPATPTPLSAGWAPPNFTKPAAAPP